jgi:hypothetical protein
MPFSVFFPDANVSIDSNETLTVRTQEYMHELIHFSLNSTIIPIQKYSTGARVSIDYNDSVSAKQFFGYIDHVVPNSTGIDSSLEFICIGTSWILKEKRQRVFHDISVTDVVTILASEYGFSLEIISDPTIWPSLVQHGISTFEFISNLAKRIGYTFYVEETEIKFLPRVGIINSTNRNQGQILTNLNILDFNSKFGDATDEGRSRVVQGINPRTNEVIYKNHSGQFENILGATGGDPAFSHFETGLIIHDLGKADAHISGRSESNRLHIKAKVRSYANCAIRTGSFVYIDLGDELNDGMWFVESAEHMIDNENISRLCLGRDSKGSAGDVPLDNNKIIVFNKNSPTGRKRRVKVPTIKSTVARKSSNITSRIPVSPRRGNTSNGVNVITNFANANQIKNQWSSAWGPGATGGKDTPKSDIASSRTASHRG